LGGSRVGARAPRHLPALGLIVQNHAPGPAVRFGLGNRRVKRGALRWNCEPATSGWFGSSAK
jgi:hypothetical protein